ncbi:MAG: hypothetical protein H7Y59_05350 [Anaerolineales bacterium]|nr:hypothetical protein [Anaerolineales bacterium]
MIETLKTIGSTLCFVLLCISPFVLIGFGVPALHYISNRRRARNKRRHNRQHESKFPYRWVAYFFLVVTLVLAAYAVMGFINGQLSLADDLDGIAALLVLPLIFATLAFRSYIMQKMPAAAEVLEDDTRPPVLYLRSFDQESLKFVHLPDAEKEKYNDFLVYADDIQLPNFERKIYNLMTQLTIVTGKAPVHGEDITFEKYFRAEVNQRIGPFVALGNPIDDLPTEGAYRDYQTDGDWKEVFFNRASQSAGILMQLGSSNNLQFELTSILSQGMCTKLFIITPPQADVKDRTAWMRKYILREKPATWETFATILKSNGYQLPAQPPGIGSVLTFEPDGSPLLLVQGAFQPAEYIQPIYTRLSDLRVL